MTLITSIGYFFLLNGLILVILFFLNKRRIARSLYRGPNVDLTGKIAIVTGSNIGIGFETAKDFARRGAHVILACRDSNSATEAVKKITLETGNSKVYFKHLDLSSFDSVREFAQEFIAGGTPCHILVCNAGKGFCPKTLTVDGYESIIATNHFGHFLLVNLLLDVLNRSSARIVVVSSALHNRGRIELDDLNWDRKPWDGRKQYSNSKLANILFSYELHRRLQSLNPPKATVNAVHPGIVATMLSRYSNARARLFFDWILVPLFGKNAEQGAQTTIHCSISPDLEGISGKYFGNCMEEKSSPQSYDEEMSKKLWEVSEKVTLLK